MLQEVDTLGEYNLCDVRKLPVCHRAIDVSHEDEGEVSNHVANNQLINGQ